jgi:hypothetical protein
MHIRADLDYELDATQALPCHSIGELAANMPLLAGSPADCVSHLGQNETHWTRSSDRPA